MIVVSRLPFGSTVDQATLGTLGAPRDAGNRRRDPRVGEVELGLLHLGAGDLDRGLGELQRRCGIVVVLARNRPLLRQRPKAVGLAAGLRGARLFLRELRLGLGERQLERLGVDLEERLSGTDRRAFVVEPLLQDAGHARPDLDLFRAFRLADGLEAYRHVLRRDVHHVHRRGRRGAAGRAARPGRCGALVGCALVGGALAAPSQSAGKKNGEGEAHEREAASRVVPVRDRV